jgi:hypothetical protein
MAKSTGNKLKRKESKKTTKPLIKKAAAKKSPTKTKTKIINYWGLVTLNKTEAYIHLAFDSPISGKNLAKWNDGYLASLLQAKTMILNASIVNDWKVEKMEFQREDPEWREQDFPFWVGKNEADGIYLEILKLNSKK